MRERLRGWWQRVDDSPFLGVLIGYLLVTVFLVFVTGDSVVEALTKVLVALPILFALLLLTGRYPAHWPRPWRRWRRR